MIFDSHAHYDDHRFDDDQEQLLESMRDKGVGMIVNVGADVSSCVTTLELARKHEFVYAALGIHPSEVEELTEANMEWIADNSSDKKVVAIGEIGLDYHWPEPEPQVQKKWFERQIEVAKQVGLPIIVHSREAANDTMDIIKNTKAYECGGIIHCFSYSKEIAKEYVDMGFMIGIGGVLTFKNAKKLVEVAKEIPLEKIVLETDCPYMSPEPHRGERNDSSKIIYVANKLAELKGITTEEVIKITEENARKLYRIL